MFDIGRLHGSTCGGSELGCAVAMKVLEITTRPETVQRVERNTELLKEHVEKLKSKYDGFLTGISSGALLWGWTLHVRMRAGQLRSLCSTAAYGRTMPDSIRIHCS